MKEDLNNQLTYYNETLKYSGFTERKRGVSYSTQTTDRYRKLKKRLQDYITKQIQFLFFPINILVKIKTPYKK